ncbi:MAG: hypothetical protein COT74_01835 [Bdellovibrionales bacterium CG10_big_fil_rev_8_21_14_0_10_45_34]|nr:MAG: hypothetical protein COT74_01835 [Bdellovibrionales bacterium CG10_big_fil_rev_8_21_14_0_10_45_34]
MALMIRRPARNWTNVPTLFGREWNDLFEDFFKGMEPLTNLKEATFVPRIDVSEKEGEYRVKAELPGIEEKDFEVTFHDNVLFLKGEKRIEKDEEGDDFHHREVRYGSFERTIPFAAEIDADKVNADFKQGVLTVTLAKAQPTERKARKIAVSNGH